MKVTALRTRYQEGSHSLLYRKDEVRAKTPEFCCDGMQSAWGGPIDFGEADAMLNQDTNVNVYQCLPYPEGAVFNAFPVNFCPFCGAPITINIVDA